MQNYFSCRVRAREDPLVFVLPPRPPRGSRRHVGQLPRGVEEGALVVEVRRRPRQGRVVDVLVGLRARHPRARARACRAAARRAHAGIVFSKHKSNQCVPLKRLATSGTVRFVLNRRVDLHAIDATPARWRGDAGSSPLDGASTAASSPRNDLVKNYRVHPTHWLISTQGALAVVSRSSNRMTCILFPRSVSWDDQCGTASRLNEVTTRAQNDDRALSMHHRGCPVVVARCAATNAWIWCQRCPKRPEAKFVSQAVLASVSGR